MARDLLLPLGAAIAVVLVVQYWVAKPYTIPTGSMAPTIDAGDRVLVNRLVYRFRAPRRGDVIVFRPTPAARQACVGRTVDEPFVKRVVAVGGDLVRVVDNVPTVNGRPLAFDHAITTPVERGSRPNFPPTRDWTVAGPPVRVPPGAFFVLGDNRPDSCDSRFWPSKRSGPLAASGLDRAFVRRRAIIGQVEFTYWPPHHLAFPG